jgi:hypothetical protein
MSAAARLETEAMRLSAKRILNPTNSGDSLALQRAAIEYAKAAEAVKQPRVSFWRRLFASTAILALCVLFCGCKEETEKGGLAWISGRYGADGSVRVWTVRADGCEYIANLYGGLCHKANCPNPEHKQVIAPRVVTITNLAGKSMQLPPGFWQFDNGNVYPVDRQGNRLDIQLGIPDWHPLNQKPKVTLEDDVGTNLWRGVRFVVTNWLSPEQIDRLMEWP